MPGETPFQKEIILRVKGLERKHDLIRTLILVMLALNIFVWGCVALLLWIQPL